jgi:hypothetical protein
MKGKRALALLLGAISVAAMAGCGGNGGAGGGGGAGGSNSKVTTIRFMDYGGGVGNEWIKQAAKRFQDLKVNESYEDGKMGVYVDITSDKAIPYDTMSTTGYHIFTTEQKADIYVMASKNEIMCMDDIISQIADIDENQQERLKGPDGKYYALPHYEWFSGITYDIDYFETKQLYFAAPEEELVIPIETLFGSRNLIGDPEAKRSCGPDGIYNTPATPSVDDGLPSSLEEFLILCDYMSGTLGKAPFAWGGQNKDYAFYLPHALWANLAGYEQMNTVYTHDTKGKEIVEVITGWTDEDLFYEGSDLKKPTTKMVAITPETGYLAFDQASRYYSLVALQVLFDMKWYNTDTMSTNNSNFDAQSHFITNSAGAMLFDSSYWYNETVTAGNIEYYEERNPGKDGNKDRRLSFMPMPSQVFGTVEEGKGHKNVLHDLGASQLFVNKRVEKNPGLTRAIKELLLFLYSDAELAAYTEETGSMRAMDYTFDNTKAHEFYNRMNEIRLLSDIVRPSSSSSIFKKNLAVFNFTWSGALQRPVINNTNFVSYWRAMEGAGTTPGAEFMNCANAQSMWQATRKKPSEWANLAR